MTSPIFLKQTPATLETVMKQNLYRAIEDDNVTLAEHYLLQLYTQMRYLTCRTPALCKPLQTGALLHLFFTVAAYSIQY